ncbi:MAG: RNB domain-containing ribonuclease [Nitrosomonadales bacterium]
MHIAAPTLGIAPGSSCDVIAAQRLSTVYIAGDKITMLPNNVVRAFTLNADNICLRSRCTSKWMRQLCPSSTLKAASSAYTLPQLAPRHSGTAIQRRNTAAGKLDYPFAAELELLWNLAQKLEAARGKSSDNSTQQADYNFYVQDDRITISTRLRGSPIDKVVSELMIFVNSEWGNCSRPTMWQESTYAK